MAPSSATEKSQRIWARSSRDCVGIAPRPMRARASCRRTRRGRMRSATRTATGVCMPSEPRTIKPRTPHCGCRQQPSDPSPPRRWRRPGEEEGGGTASRRGINVRSLKTDGCDRGEREIGLAVRLRERDNAQQERLACQHQADRVLRARAPMRAPAAPQLSVASTIIAAEERRFAARLPRGRPAPSPSR